MNSAHTFDEPWCVLGMLKGEFEVVDDGQPFRGHPRSLGRSLPVDISGAALAQVVHVRQRSAEAILELGQFPRLRALGYGAVSFRAVGGGHIIVILGSHAGLANLGRQAILSHSFTVKSASMTSSSVVPPPRSPGCSPAGWRATSP